ncbi:MAG: 50S ribosomal protein L20 [Bacilli bacterium]|nr:50S ribosomal protein L20 [Bacilli bacterium]
MARVKNSVTTKARHKKVLKAAKGYFGSKHRLYKTAKEQLMHSGQYAFRDRRQKKRDFRKLWITRINAACRENEISYSRFIEGLNKAGVEVNRKMLSEVAIADSKAFAELVKVAKNGLDGKVVAASKEEVVTVEVVKVKETKTEAKKETKKEEKEKVEKAEKKPAAKKATTTKKVESKKEEKEEKKPAAKKTSAAKKTTVKKETKKETK